MRATLHRVEEVANEQARGIPRSILRPILELQAENTLLTVEGRPSYIVHVPAETPGGREHAAYL
jgi:hypothetical protein